MYLHFFIYHNSYIVKFTSKPELTEYSSYAIARGSARTTKLSRVLLAGGTK